MSLDDVKLTLIDSMEDVFDFFRWMGNSRPYHALGVDTETTGLDIFNDKIRLMQIGDHTHGWAFAWDDWKGIFKDVIHRWDGDYILHNSPFDLGMLSSENIHIPRHRVHDTMVEAAIVEPHMSKALKTQASRHVDASAAGLQAELAGTKWTFANVPIDYEPYWCVPKTTEILTRTGWKKWDEVKVNEDETLGYDNDKLRWTLITGVHDPGIAPVVKFGNQYWSTLCTPNHRWVMRKGNDVGIHPLNEGWSSRKGVTRLIRSAPADGGDSPLTSNEAAILAWVLSDGSFQWQRPKTQSSPWVAIVQSTKKFTDEIRELLQAEDALGNEWVHPSQREQDDYIIRFSVKPGYFTDLWRKANLDKYGVRSSAFRDSDISLLELVMSLSPEARAAWNSAWINAEGTRGKNTLKQNRGAKLDAVMLSLYMDGYAVTAADWKRSDVKCVGVRYTHRDPTPQKTHYTPAGHVDVWCPTTGNSTWTARDENGNIFVTGNTYGALDPVLTYKLHEHHFPTVMSMAPKAYEIEMAVLWVVEKMRRYGTYIDKRYAEEKYAQFMQYCADVESWCKNTYNVKPGSNQSIIQVLQNDGVEFDKLTASGAFSLDGEVLESIDHPLASAVLNRRKAQKMASTYLKFYIERPDDNGLIHPSFNTLGAKTGRMSCSDPNLQNLPRLGTSRFGDVVRNCIKTRHGLTWDMSDENLTSQMKATRTDSGSLVMCDYSQIEMRMLAHFAREEAMINAFKSDEDFFVNLARQIFQDDTIDRKSPRRQITKNAGYATIYAAGIRKFAQTAGIPESQAREFMNRWNQLYPNVRRFQDETLHVAIERRRATGIPYAESPLTGRRFVADQNKEYALINYIVQGSAAEVNKMKLIELDAAGLGEWMFATVHDEVLLDVPGSHVRDVVHTLLNIMNDDTLLSVPIQAEASFGERWGKKIDWTS